MLLRQMQFFISIVEEKSFTEAAAKNFISQSAISQSMNALEAELGVKLLERKNNRNFKITPAGEYFYRKAKMVLAEIEELRKQTMQIGNGETASLRIGYINLYAGPELSETIGEFAAKYPGVNISVRSGTHEELYNGLVTGELDLALNDQRRAFSSEYVNMELKDADCMAEISRRSPLASAVKIDVKELADSTCIIVASQGQRDTETEYYRNILGFSGDFVYVDTKEEAQLMVIGNRGFLPVEAVGKLPDAPSTVTRIPLYRNKRKLKRKYCLFWLQERAGYYIEEFAKILRQKLI